MRVGILTMNYVCNYGGILQCLALQKILESRGAEVVVIRYSSNKKKNVKKKLRLLFAGLPLKSYLSWTVDLLSDMFTRITGMRQQLPKNLLRKCSSFISENIHYTELCDEQTIGELVQRMHLDAIVIGSDKIWGAVSDEQLVYFGDWVPEFKGDLISYAACSSRECIPSFNQQKIRELFSRFSHISVRDVYSKNLFQPFTEKPISIVADPTVLYGFKEYYVEENVQPYILTYILGRKIKGGHKEALSEIKKKIGQLPVKSIILSNESTDIVNLSDEIIYDASPIEWLNLIRNAAFVYTDSFHGIMFSLKFQRDFIAYYREASRASRLLDLMHYFDLSLWIVSSVAEMKQKSSLTIHIEYEDLQQKIDRLRNESLLYLKQVLWK